MWKNGMKHTVSSETPWSKCKWRFSGNVPFPMHSLPVALKEGVNGETNVTYETTDTRIKHYNRGTALERSIENYCVWVCMCVCVGGGGGWSNQFYSPLIMLQLQFTNICLVRIGVLWHLSATQIIIYTVMKQSKGFSGDLKQEHKRVPILGWSSAKLLNRGGSRYLVWGPHYENTPIQIYRQFHLQNLNFQIKKSDNRMLYKYIGEAVLTSTHNLCCWAQIKHKRPTGHMSLTWVT